MLGGILTPLLLHRMGPELCTWNCCDDPFLYWGAHPLHNDVRNAAGEEWRRLCLVSVRPSPIDRCAEHGGPDSLWPREVEDSLFSLHSFGFEVLCRDFPLLDLDEVRPDRVPPARVILLRRGGTCTGRDSHAVGEGLGGGAGVIRAGGVLFLAFMMGMQFLLYTMMFDVRASPEVNR